MTSSGAGIGRTDGIDIDGEGSGMLMRFCAGAAHADAISAMTTNNIVLAARPVKIE